MKVANCGEHRELRITNAAQLGRAEKRAGRERPLLADCGWNNIAA
jgi:hypothetical protein